MVEYSPPSETSLPCLEGIPAFWWEGCGVIVVLIMLLGKLGDQHTMELKIVEIVKSIKNPVSQVDMAVVKAIKRM